jgi:hypothetical protein
MGAAGSALQRSSVSDPSALTTVASSGTAHASWRPGRQSQLASSE